MRQRRKGAACANQTLAVRPGRAPRLSSDVLNSIEEADEVFPGEVVDDQTDGSGDRKSMGEKVRDWKIQKASNDDTERREQNWQERTVQADGQLPAIAQGHEENIPKAPCVELYGHREDDHALHGNENVINVAEDNKQGSDD